MPIFCPVPIVGYGSRSAELQKSIIDNWNQTASEDCRRPGHRKIAGDPGIGRLQETQASEDCRRPRHLKIAGDPGIGRLQETRASEDCRRPGHRKIAGDPGIGRLQALGYRYHYHSTKTLDYSDIINLLRQYQ